MSLKVSPIAVWAVDVVNRPGMLARVLEGLRNAGANLEFVIARRVTANTSRIFLAPLKGAAQARAASDLRVEPARGLHTLRVEGPDRPGVGADLTRALAAAGLNIRGLSSCAIGNRFVCYIAFATPAEARSAARVLSTFTSAPTAPRTRTAPRRVAGKTRATRARAAKRRKR